MEQARFLSALHALAGEARAGAVGWENDSLAAYLEALAAWLRVHEAAYRNSGVEVPSDPWQIFADALRAATLYE